MPKRSLLLISALVGALASPVAAQAAAPKRIVALTPYSANTMALLGVRPIAVGQALADKNLFAPSLRTVPVLPLTHPNGPNLEQISKLNVDLVMTGSAWARGTASIKRLGVRVADREPGLVTEVPRQTKRIGALIGKAKAGATLAKIQENQIKAATKNIRKRPSVLLVLGVGSTPYAFLPNSWGGDVIKRAGGTLITGSLKSSSGYARISDEFVVAKNPDIIIALPHGNPSNLGKVAAQLRSRPGWRTTRAARNKKVFISTNNTLLQPIAGAGATIAAVRRGYLGN